MTLVDCLIEIPRGSHQKYELDKKTGMLRLDRVLYSAVFYPANYGFIPRTYCDDQDPLDILVLGQEPVQPMCLLTARPIGVMQMIDQDEEDDKIIAVHEHDPAFCHYRDISQLPPHTLYELQQFFEDYKVLEKKKVRIEKRLGHEEAHAVIVKSIELYNASYDGDGKKKHDAPILDSERAQHEKARHAIAESARRQAARLQASDQKKTETVVEAGGSAPPNSAAHATNDAASTRVEDVSAAHIDKVTEEAGLPPIHERDVDANCCEETP
jgi:inorganic pyrophosphatase